MERYNLTLTLLVVFEEGLYVAQCLEYDISAQAGTRAGAIEDWCATLSTSIHTQRGEFFNNPPAPVHYWKRAREVVRNDLEAFRRLGGNPVPGVALCALIDFGVDVDGAEEMSMPAWGLRVDLGVIHEPEPNELRIVL